jgi:hypothetical protein
MMPEVAHDEARAGGGARPGGAVRPGRRSGAGRSPRAAADHSARPEIAAAPRSGPSTTALAARGGASAAPSCSVWTVAMSLTSASGKVVAYP